MKFKTLVILGLIAVFLAGIFLQAQGAIEIRAASSTAVAGWQSLTVDGGETVWVSPTVSLTSADIARTEARPLSGGQAGVGVVFTADGARKMQALSRAQTNQRIAMLLDGKVIWAPVVRATIDTEAVMSGLTVDEARRLVTVLKGQ
jgi:preprotein translocase subunit SecD